jgi:hypothetical protein
MASAVTSSPTTEDNDLSVSKAEIESTRATVSAVLADVAAKRVFS